MHLARVRYIILLLLLLQGQEDNIQHTRQAIMAGGGVFAPIIAHIRTHPPPPLPPPSERRRGQSTQNNKKERKTSKHVGDTVGMASQRGPLAPHALEAAASPNFRFIDMGTEPPAYPTATTTTKRRSRLKEMSGWRASWERDLEHSYCNKRLPNKNKNTQTHTQNAAATAAAVLHHCAHCCAISREKKKTHSRPTSSIGQ